MSKAGALLPQHSPVGWEARLGGWESDWQGACLAWSALHTQHSSVGWDASIREVEVGGASSATQEVLGQTWGGEVPGDSVVCKVGIF